jgi:excisionase family DNA binding protein
VAEVAQLLGTHPKTIERAARRGRLPFPAIKVGGTWRFGTRAVLASIGLVDGPSPSNVDGAA